MVNERDEGTIDGIQVRVATPERLRREDQVLATEITEFVKDMPVRRRSEMPQRKLERWAWTVETARTPRRVQSIADRDRKGPEITR